MKTLSRIRIFGATPRAIALQARGKLTRPPGDYLHLEAFEVFGHLKDFDKLVLRDASYHQDHPH